MKKGQIYEGTVDKVRFPNKGIVRESLLIDESGDVVPSEGGPESCQVTVKNVLPGQRVRFRVSRKRSGTAEGRLLGVTERSPAEMEGPACVHFGTCGGCRYQTLPYDEQLRLKSEQVLDLLRDVVSVDPAGTHDAEGLPGAVCPDPAAEYVVEGIDDIFEGIRPSPRQFGYRNKMEFTFGDEYKGGPLALGLHRLGGMYDIVSVDRCRIADGDFRKILTATQDYFRGEGTPFYHRLRHDGYLRHLLVRKAAHTGEILIDLVTAGADSCPVGEAEDGAAEMSGKAFDIGGCGKSPERTLLDGWCECLLSLTLDGMIAGILHTNNDSPADAVVDEGTEILFGQDYFYEEILGLRFRITPFSFFQTNSTGAEVLYETAREMIGGALGAEGSDGESVQSQLIDKSAGKVIFDLYSGTGTIAQMLAPAAKKVVGVEIVEEAVEAARENARENGLGNCEFIAGDVLRVLDELEEKPDFIVLDPPRDGIHPKALRKIIDYGVGYMLYISCKPTSLARDLTVLQESGYRAERICCVDMFPGTVHVETVVLLRRKYDNAGNFVC